jgi:hypothetical protein
VSKKIIKFPGTGVAIFFVNSLSSPIIIIALSRQIPF